MGPSLAGHHGALADPNWPRPSVSIARAMAEAADGDEHLALTIQLSLDHAQPQGTAPAFGDGLAPRAAGEDSPHHAPAAELPEPAPAAEPPALSVGQLAGMWGRDASRAGAPRFKLTDLQTKRETEVPHTGIADAFTIGRGSIFDIDLHSDEPTPAGGDLHAIVYSLASGSYVFAIDHTSAHLDTRTDLGPAWTASGSGTRVRGTRKQRPAGPGPSDSARSGGSETDTLLRCMQTDDTHSEAHIAPGLPSSGDRFTVTALPPVAADTPVPSSGWPWDSRPCAGSARLPREGGSGDRGRHHRGGARRAGTWRVGSCGLGRHPMPAGQARMPAGLSCPSPCAKRWLGCPWLHGPRSPWYAPGTGSGASGTHVHPSPWSVSQGPVADASPGPLPPGPGGRTPGGQTFGSSPPIGSHDGLGARLSNCDQVLTASGYRLVTATWHVAPRAATWAWS